MSCGVDKYNKTTGCLSCIGNLMIEDGECVFPGCEEFSTSVYNVMRKNAKCLTCESGFGLSHDWKCIPCMEAGNSKWDNCAECTIDSNNKPHTCAVCDDDDLVLVHNLPGMTPINYCVEQAIENCVV
jgi:hypothetical protein